MSEFVCAESFEWLEEEGALISWRLWPGLRVTGFTYSSSSSESSPPPGKATSKSSPLPRWRLLAEIPFPERPLDTADMTRLAIIDADPRRLFGFGLGPPAPSIFTSSS
eukprot:scaffold46117_cov57-Attheya_sp.AAC.1